MFHHTITQAQFVTILFDNHLDHLSPCQCMFCEGTNMLHLAPKVVQVEGVESNGRATHMSMLKLLSARDVNK